MMADGSGKPPDKSVVIGPLKLTDYTRKERWLVTLLCTKEGTGRGVPDGCRIRVFKSQTAALLAGRPFGRTSDKIRLSLLLHDYVITPRNAINVESFKSIHGKPKLAVTFHSNEDDVLGIYRYKELVFKDQGEASTSHVAKLERILRQGPYKDMHTFIVEIIPHQTIPEGPAGVNIFPTHISVTKRFTTEQQQENSKKKLVKTSRKLKMKRLPLVVTMTSVKSYCSLSVGFRFDTSQKAYFFKCCRKDGEDMSDLMNNLLMTSRGVLKRPDTAGSTEPTYVNEWEARRCELEIQGGIKLNVGVFAAKPEPGQPWVLYFFIDRQGASLHSLKQRFPAAVEMVCPSRAFQMVDDLSINVDLPDGWSTINVVKEVPKTDFSALEDPFIHDICIQHENHDKKQFHGRIYIRQGLSETLRITLNVITNFSLYERVGKKRAEEPLYDLVPATRGRSEPTGDTPIWLRQFSERRQLWEKLDTYNLFGNDWRLFAEKIGLDYQAIVTIENHSRARDSRETSPTELVLREWERGRTAVPVSEDALVRILHDMGRPDIIQDMRLQVPELQDLRVEATTSTTIHVTWEPASDDVTHYTIEMTPADGSAPCHRRQENCRSLVFRDLNPDTVYDICIQPAIQRVTGEWINITAKTEQACDVGSIKLAE
ncbi:uncharacterized protein [Branchiostoma lanceolatum]|uniref:uncharacterized protein n=1 Tax=Branchiostoma lanceolatum TaxID=7740 RepID=UPI003452E227